VSYWAELDENNYVLRVIVCDDNDPNGDEGYQWIMSNLGGTWIKTDMNNPIPEKIAGVSLLYDKEKDVYVNTPFFSEGTSWWFDPNTNKWERV
jgi:hypothetical protein